MEPHTAGTKGAGQAGDNRKPTYDQLYLASRLSPEDAPQGRLTPAAIQRLNMRFGVNTVTDAMRLMHGFPPDEAIVRPYAYLVGILRSKS